MLFNSSVFAIFLVVVLALYYPMRLRAQNFMLLAASYLFYGWWDWRFTSLLAISTIVDFVLAKRIRADQENGGGRARFYLIASCVVNLGILATFKYCDFFIQSATAVLNAFGFDAHVELVGLVLPVGISFYTFQTMSYTIDVYRGQQEPTNNILDFALYVAFFPQLVAGPIERSTHLLPQISTGRRVTVDDLRIGSALMVMGYFKKMVIADSAAVYADIAFNDPSGNVGALLGVYFFAIQIYGDFAGYTDIARGVARLMGFDLCLNFRQPYLSSSITEFWRRWHISLSSWLRDYLYISFGGNRLGPWKTYRNLMLVMLLGGLWHGASWNFVIWGGLHGTYLAVERMFASRNGHKKADRPRGGFGTWLKWFVGTAITFHLVCLAWILFRAHGLDEAFRVLHDIVTLHSPIGSFEVLAVFVVLVLLTLMIDVPCWWSDREVPVPASWPAVVRGVLYGIMIAVATFVGPSGGKPFVYFQF